MPRPAKKKKTYTKKPAQKVTKQMNVRSMGVPGVAPRTGGFRAGYGSKDGEKKTIDIPASGTGTGSLTNLNFNSTGSVVLLNGVAQGTDYNARVGRKIVMKSLYVRGMIYIEAAVSGGTLSATIPAQAARLILIADMQTNGAAPGLGDIIQTTGTSPNIEAQLNLNNRDRFKVLKDKVYTFGTMSTDDGGGISAGVGPAMHSVKIYKKLNMETIFGGTDATIGSITSGGLYLVAIGSVAAGPADVNCRLTSRIRFTDP